MTDTDKGLVIGGWILLIAIMISCCCCCCCCCSCCRSNRPNNQEVIVVQPATGPSVISTSNNVIFPMQPLPPRTWDTTLFAETNPVPGVSICHCACLTNATAVWLESYTTRVRTRGSTSAENVALWITDDDPIFINIRLFRSVQNYIFSILLSTQN